MSNSGANESVSIRHHFTVDVEEYFHPLAMAPFVPRSAWADLPRRSPRVIERLLALLDERGARATFFTVGWLAEKEPGMLRAIASAGHEIGSHSWDHVPITAQTREQLRESLRRSKAVLEDIAGVPVRGFRAPSFSIVPGLEWALDVLLEEGYEYDSSLFPITQHPSYGYPGTPTDPYRVKRTAGEIVEIPPSTLRVAGTNLPAAGGAYLRFFPLGLIRGALRQAERRGAPGTFYVHPWELDDHVPDVPIGFVARVRTFSSLGDTWARIRALLGEFRFGRIDDVLERVGAPAVSLV